MLKEEFEKKAGLKISHELYNELCKDYEDTDFRNNDEYIKALFANPSVRQFINECMRLRKDMSIIMEGDRNAASKLLDYINESAVSDEDISKLQVIIGQLMRYDEIIKIKLKKGYKLTRGERDWLCGIIDFEENGKQE